MASASEKNWRASGWKLNGKSFSQNAHFAVNKLDILSSLHGRIEMWRKRAAFCCFSGFLQIKKFFFNLQNFWDKINENSRNSPLIDDSHTRNVYLSFELNNKVTQMKYRAKEGNFDANGKNFTLIILLDCFSVK